MKADIENIELLLYNWATKLCRYTNIIVISISTIFFSLGFIITYHSCCKVIKMWGYIWEKRLK